MSAPRLHLALLAGGRGTRFWPLSRRGLPKQFLRLGGAGGPGRDGTLLQRTVARYAPAIPIGDVLVVAGPAYRDLVAANLPDLPPGNLLVEPSPRDTAPAVCLAAIEARRRDPSTVLVVSPTDHRVADTRAFLTALSRAVERARSGGLGTLGVTPDRPATSFGYLRTEGSADATGALSVERFVEKPDTGTARGYMEDGRHLWNAGIFLFRVDRFFAELARSAPELAEGAARLERALAAGDPAGIESAWSALPATSIDYALMEKAGDVWTVPLDAGWDDFGGWEAAEKLLAKDARGNSVSGAQAVFLGTSRTTVFGRGGDADAGEGRVRTTVLVGVEDLIVVDTEDVLLVCRRDSAEQVKRAVEEIARTGREDLL